jgi:flagellar biosynthetic protein FliR
MLSFSQLNEAQILLFALILLRMSAFVVSAALFNSTAISAPLKILFSVVLAMVLFAPVGTNEALVRVNESQSQLLLLAGREVFLGLVLGFVTRMFFFAVSMAGEIVSLSMGLGQAQMFNPIMGSMSNAMEQFYSVIATLLFLALDGHHMMLMGLAESFSASPVALLDFNVGTLAEVVTKTQSFFVIGIKIAAPVMISMIVIQVGIALLSRVVPQINVIVTSASITILAGFLIMFISLPLLVMQMTGLLDFSMGEFFKFLKAI